MEKSMFEMKVEEAIKPLEEICEKLVCCTKSELEKGTDSVDAKELGEVVDAIKDLCEAKYYVAEGMYKTEIGKAMEENADDYGETWDENGKKYYRRRDSKGRFMYTEPAHVYYRDMDKPYGRMYFAENDGVASPMGARNYSGNEMSRNYDGMRNYNSRYEMAKRHYTESKALHDSGTAEDVEANTKEMEKWIQTFADELKEKLPEMEQEEKIKARNILIGVANSMN